MFCKKGGHAIWKSEKKKKEKEQERLAKEQNKKKRKVPWEQDGSLKALLDWLTTEGNYAACAGANKKKQGDSQVCLPQTNC